MNRYIEEYAKFLSLTHGRGFFYLYIGSVGMARSGIFSMIQGLFLIACGVMSIIVGRQIQTKLNAVKAQLIQHGGDTSAEDASPMQLKEQFDLFDADGSGALSSANIQSLCSALGAPLQGADEINAAMNHLDKDRSGKVEFSEFQAWFTSRTNMV